MTKMHPFLVIYYSCTLSTVTMCLVPACVVCSSRPVVDTCAFQIPECVLICTSALQPVHSIHQLLLLQ